MLYTAGSCAVSERVYAAAIEMCPMEAGSAELIEQIKSVTVHRRAPMQLPALSALAAAIVHLPTFVNKTSAFDAISIVVCTPTHLFALLGRHSSVCHAARSSNGWAHHANDQAKEA